MWPSIFLGPYGVLPYAMIGKLALQFVINYTCNLMKLQTLLMQLIALQAMVLHIPIKFISYVYIIICSYVGA